jgi:exosortase C (VPDSG-CTERM-specific)
MNTESALSRFGGPLREVFSALASPALRPWLIGSAIILVAFSPFLYSLTVFALGSNLYSHIPLMPLISGYLVWQDRESPPAASATLPRFWAAIPALGGLVCLLAYAALRLGGTALSKPDSLALTTGGFLLMFYGVCLAFLDRRRLRRLSFPLALLLFMVPFPDAVEALIEMVLQHGSAEVAHVLFLAAGTTLYRQELVFQLPNITLEVAPQCSGIHSTLALFITSLVAGYLFLRSPLHRSILTLFVLPLALVRNGFRVFTLGALCVNFGPHMIDSFIHHRGGPIFFSLSLIPFSLVLFLLVRRERKSPSPASNPSA